MNIERTLCTLAKMAPFAAVKRIGWNREYGSMYWADKIHGCSVCLDLILTHTPNGSTIVDLGCGEGTMAKHVFESGWHGSYIGYDLSTVALQQAVAKCPQADWRRGMISDPPCFHPETLLFIESIYYVPVEVARKAIEDYGAKLIVCRMWNRQRYDAHAQMLIGLGFKEERVHDIGAIFHRISNKGK